MHAVSLLMLALAPAADPAADPAAPAPPAYDTLVVCPTPLVEAMQPWFAHRLAQGRKIGLVRDGDTPEKIRLAIRHAAEGGKLTHVLLVGDDHPDRLEDAALRSVTLPSKHVKAKVNVHWGSEAEIATDNWYADLDDDQAPDVAIGRLTADTPAQLAVMVAKILAYENAPPPGAWRRRVNFIAGVGGFGPITDAVLDMATKKFITSEIPAGYQTSMTYASLTSPYCPDPRLLPDVALARHNEGCLFWVYVGHGQRRWLDNMRVGRHAFPIMNVDHVTQMHAAEGSPVAVFLACYAGAFDEREDCLSEEMLAAPGGPTAVISGTRVTMPYGNAVLGHAMLQECFTHGHATLGEVLMCAKQSTASNRADGASRRLMDALAAAISPRTDLLEEERIEH
ncbi:MAG: hypothetical protein KDA41_21190, partial [Planctomycetales bacterium]|nr:hypothetical protein [Planctomycetales bacterium]